MNKSPRSNLPRLLRNVALIVVIFVIYAYGLQVTQVDLDKPQEEKRQEQLTNILRGLARPDLIAYDIDRIELEAPILIPCSGPAPEVPEPQLGQPHITLSSYCAEPGETITVFGSGLDDGENVFIFFVPYAADSANQVELKLATEAVQVESDGTFAHEVKLKKDRLSEHPQTIRAVVNRRFGSIRPSQALIDTVDKIIETIFLALLATTLGVIVGVPVSFLAARNLMSQVNASFTKFMAMLVAIPIGGYLGYILFSALRELGKNLVSGGTQTSTVWFWGGTFALIGLASIVQQPQPEEIKERAQWFLTLRRAIIIILVTIGVVLGLAILGQVGRDFGLATKPTPGAMGVFGNFVLIVSDAILLGLSFIGTLIGLALFSSFAGRTIDNSAKSMSTGLQKVITIILAAVAGALWFSLVILAINWFYQFGQFPQVIAIPAIIGAIAFAALAIINSPDRMIHTGMFVYYISRTIMNVLRSIEPLLMVVAFAVWVGIGPFAGVMALGLHTIVALGKLYSEQVESIVAGPIEAVTATGATSLQTIIYAVIPQIVPPYIAFTLYRWDINVRMSTIIGFGGGGGIGFLLSQNINLLKYRQAAVNMIAIALVVITLDYVSAKVREKIT